MTGVEHRRKVALIGAGMVARAYVESFAALADDMVLCGVLARSNASAARFLQQHRATLSEAVAYPDLAALLADRPDMVIIITPPDQRAAYVTALAQEGIPILMEKPVERTVDAARALVETCEKAGIPLGIVLQHRVRPSAQMLRDVVQRMDPGPLHLVEISVPWWRAQVYYDEPGRGSLARDGGGVLISQAIHTLDLALQFTGPVESVNAMCRTSGFHRMQTEDFVTAGLTFANGAAGSLLASTATFPGRTEEIILHYQNVSITLRSAELILAWQDGRTEITGAAVATGAGSDPMAFTSDWHRAVIADFLTCLETGATPVASGRSALAVHGLIAAISEAGTSGHTILLNKDKTT